MTNPNDPICGSEHDIPSGQGGTIPANWKHKGITKREFFAAMAMNSMLRFSIFDKSQENALVKRSQWCVQVADALISELNKSEK